MPKRFLAPLALAAVLVGAGCSDSASPALRIGDATFSHDEVLDEVEEWAGNPEIEASFGTVEGLAPNSFTSELTTSVVRYRIIRELVAAEAVRQGVEPDDQNREQAITNIFGDQQTADTVLGGFSDEYADSFMEHAAAEAALVEEMGGVDPFVEWVSEASADEHIEISSRFGTWDAETQNVLPPEGPLTSTTVADPLAEPAPAG